MSDEREPQLVLLAATLREIHHQRYMSIHFAAGTPRWMSLRENIATNWRQAQWRVWHWYRMYSSVVYEDNAGNQYRELPYPIPLPGMTVQESHRYVAAMRSHPTASGEQPHGEAGGA